MSNSMQLQGQLYIELTIVFVRGSVRHALGTKFRDSIKDNKIVPLHSSSTVTPQSCLGLTVIRAIREQDRRYLSTVIQLPFLSSIFY